MELKWGTDDPIQVRDKVYGIRTSVQARGSYKVRIENPALFLEKLIGNNVRGLNQNELNKYFKNEMLMQIKSCVSKFLLLYEMNSLELVHMLAKFQKQFNHKLTKQFQNMDYVV